MNRLVYHNLHLLLGVIVSDQSSTCVKYRNQIHVLTINNTVEELTESRSDKVLKSYFLEAYPELYKGDLFQVINGMRSLNLQLLRLTLHQTVLLLLTLLYILKES